MAVAIGPVAPLAQTATAAPGLAPGAGPVDDTADLPQDTITTLAENVSRRAELIALATQSRQQEQQARLDRMRANFNETQERCAERMREMNALRDMAIEQAKKDDEILKKYIAMI